MQEEEGKEELLTFNSVLSSNKLKAAKLRSKVFATNAEAETVVALFHAEDSVGTHLSFFHFNSVFVEGCRKRTHLTLRHFLNPKVEAAQRLPLQFATIERQWEKEIKEGKKERRDQPCMSTEALRGEGFCCPSTSGSDS